MGRVFWRPPDDTRQLFIRLSNVHLSKVDDDGRTVPIPQNDIPDVNVIVQDAVPGLNSTEPLHDLAGDHVCLLRDVDTRFPC